METAVALGTAGAAEKTKLQLGVVVTPVLDLDKMELAQELKKVLDERYPDVRWEITVLREALVTPPAALSEIVDAARSRLLDEKWDLVVYVTELPLRIARRPLLTHSSPTHGAALVSLPALGLGQQRRLVSSIADAVGMIVGDTTQRRDEDRPDHKRRIHRRFVELAAEVEGVEALEGMALLHRVVTGNMRLLIGMVRANHPFHLATRLAGALAGALGVAAFAIVTSDIWRIASRITAPRLAAVCLITIGGAVAALITIHGLWEQAADRRVREQTMLFNIVTLITVSFGMVAMYAAICVISLGAGELAIEPVVMSAQIGHHSNFGDYLRLALLAGALATVGSALGGALESDAAVREATYGYRHHDS